MESIFVWGINHRSDSVEARERLMRALATSGDDPSTAAPPPWGWHEAVLLATCHRVECYGVVDDAPGAIRSELLDQLSSRSGADRRALDAVSYTRSGRGAVDHLCRVAAGLDSLALGEAQILHQLKRAKASAEDRHTIGPVLHQLVQRAIHLGKRARTETDISRHPVSMASIGVDRAAARLESLADKAALVVGAGHIATLAARRLRDHGIGEMRIANRHRERAASLVDSYGARFFTLAELRSALEGVDLVISASGASETLLQRADLANALDDRASPLVVVDLALPRDVDPKVDALSGVELHNVDDLRDVVQAHRKRRQAAIEPIERMIAQEVEQFAGWMKERDAASLIGALRHRAEAIRAEELESTLRRLQLDDPDQEALVEQLTRRLMNKLLHQPTVRIKQWAGNGHGLRPDEIADLFGLDDPEQPASKED